MDKSSYLDQSCFWDTVNTEGSDLPLETVYFQAEVLKSLARIYFNKMADM